MAVNQGLKNLTTNSPSFSNQGTQNLINAITAEFVTKTKTLATKVDASDVLTNTNRSDIRDSMDVQSYLDVGRYLVDLDNHTAKILTGELGEQDPNDDTPNTGTFLDHLQQVQSFIANVPNLYGYSADSIGKGIKGHFGTLSGAVDSSLESIKTASAFIESKNPTGLTDYKNSVQALSDFIDTLGDSSAFDESTFNSLLSDIESKANTLNTNITGGIYTDSTSALNTERSKIKTQITLEQTNLGVIRTYDDTLANSFRYLSLSEDSEVRKLLLRSSQNSQWKEYFENYDTRSRNDNPLYNNPNSDSSNDQIVDQVLRLKGLPDVTDYLDVPSVVAKATRDTRLATRLGDANMTNEKFLRDACDLLGIKTFNKDVFGLSKSLLENMNNFDRETVKSELNLHNEVNTIS